jgi:RNA polymerase sigma factor (TIGR02999 family)
VPEHDLTRLLQAHAAGDPAALDELLPRVYEELRRLARARFRGERTGHTLQPTALVHEAYLELARLDRIRWQNRAQFFALAARAMRNVLADHAVAKRAAKRGGERRPVPLDEVELADGGPSVDLLALRQALDRLEAIDSRQVRVLECRLFGGLSIDETAAALGISAATVSRDWTFARAWLARELGGRGAEEVEGGGGPGAAPEAG